MARTRQAPPPVRRGFPIWPVVIAVVVVAGVIAVLVALLAGNSDDEPAGNGDGLVEESAPPVEVSGTPLPEFTDTENDPAVGQPFPALTGVGLDGEPLAITPGSEPMIVLYLAHWCPHCQREVPEVQQWVDDGNVPSGVALFGVSTAIDPARPNYPGSEWLDREGWTTPTLVDPDNAAADAAGLTAFPFFVAVDGDGRVAARATGERTTGELTTDQLDALVTAIRPT